MKLLSKFLCIFLLCSFSLKGYGQYWATLTLGSNTPTYNYTDANTGFAITATGKYVLTEQMRVGLNLGYSWSRHKDNAKAGVSIIPISGLFNYYLRFNKFQPYGGAELGVYFIQDQIFNASIVPGSFGTPVSTSSSIKVSDRLGLGTVPVVGCTYMLKGKIELDCNIKYHFVVSNPTYSSLGFQIGASYLFGSYQSKARRLR